MGRQPMKYHGYVSFEDDDKISIFTTDPTTGQLDWQEDVVVEGGPAPLAISPDKNFLYAGRRGRQEISCYRIDRGTGGLSLLGTVPLQGVPIYVSTDRTGKFVLSAYYYQSTAAVHAVGADGVPLFPPVEWRYTAFGAHAILTDRSNRRAAHRAAYRQPRPQRDLPVQVRRGERSSDPQRSPSVLTTGIPRAKGARVSPEPRRGVFLRRARLERLGLQPRSIGGNTLPASDDIKRAGGVQRPEYLFPDSNCALRKVSLRHEPGPRQRRQFLRRFIDRPADGHGSCRHGAGAEGVQSRSWRGISLRCRAGVWARGVLPGRPGFWTAHATRDLSRREQPDVGADRAAVWIANR